MKNKTIILFICVIPLLMGCPFANDDILIPADLVSDHTNQLINNGSDILDDVINDYTYLPNLEIAPILETFTDYALFPYLWEGPGTPFDERMKSVYWSDENLVETYQLMVEEDQEEIPSLSCSDQRIIAQLIGLAVDIYKTAKTAAQNDERNRILEMNGETLREIESTVKAQNIEVIEALDGIKNELGGISSQLRTMNGTLLDIRSYLGQMEKRIQYQLDTISTQLNVHLKTIDRTLTNFRLEMREHLSDVNSKIDTVIDRIDDLKGDVNALQSDVDWLSLNIITQDLNNNINAVNSFLLDYGSTATLDQAQSLAESYVNVHSDIVLNFIDAALAMQDYAQNPARGDMYTDWVSEENNSMATKLRYTVELSDTTTTTYYFDYANPKQSLAISYGNLEYLYKIFMTRFIIHHLLYTGYELEQTNSNYASNYLDLLESKGIKSSFETTIQDMDDTYSSYITMVDNDFSKYGDVAEVVFERFDSDSGWSEIGDSTTMDADDMKEEITDAYIHTFVDYIGPYAAELLSMEVDLQAYIVN